VPWQFRLNSTLDEGFAQFRFDGSN